MSRGVTEGHHIGYKQALTGESKTKKYTVILKDSSGFANANGGDIIIGVKEPDGTTPSEELIVGVEGGGNLALCYAICFEI